MRADGSVHIQIAAKGEAVDLADGYPLPLGSAWKPASPATETWMQAVRSGTDRNVQEEHLTLKGWPSKVRAKENRLVVEREFARVEDIPASFADPKDPYAEAFSRRTASLEIIERGGKTVYIFERTFHGLPYGRGLFSRMLEEDGRREHPLLTKLADGGMTAEDWEELSVLASEIHAPLAREFVLESLQAHYERGSAFISAQRVDGLLEEIDKRTKQVFGAQALKVFSAGGTDRDVLFWMGVWDDFRNMIRSVLKEKLGDSDLEATELNAILFELEREFTEYDHALDLFYETFDVTLTLPGALVTGNFDSKDGATATWKFHAFELLVGDKTLRAVSVLE